MNKITQNFTTRLFRLPSIVFEPVSKKSHVLSLSSTPTLFSCQRSYNSGTRFVGLLSLPTLLNPRVEGSKATELNQIRGRKRALKRPLSKQERAERRAKREAKIAERKKFTYMQRVLMQKMKNVQSISMQGPGRYEPADEANLLDQPSCNIYFRDEVKTRFYSLSEALALHRLIQQPAIYGNIDAPLQLRLELNMTTEKSTKMIADSSELVAIPHPFKHKEKRTILAFVEGKELQEQAVEAGADIALGKDVIKKILKGQFMIDDYDFCVAHINMAMDVVTLRGILRSRFPTKINGALGDDLPTIIKSFIQGVKIVIKADHIYPQWGLAEPIIGRLNMADEEIEGNVKSIVEAVCRHRNPGLGPFINRASLLTLPGNVHYAIDVSAWYPEATESQLKLLEKKKKKKKEKSTKEESPSILDSDEGQRIIDPRSIDPLFYIK